MHEKNNIQIKLLALNKKKLLNANNFINIINMYTIFI